MRKFRFTIVELLIAMGLMMLVTNILSTIYARMAQQSMRIVKEQSDRVLSQMAINMISRDFSLARINNGGSGSGGRVFRLLSSFADTKITGTSPNVKVLADDFLATNNIKQSAPSGYPYIAMTAIDKSATNAEILAGTSDGYKEIAYWLVPNDTANDNGGSVKDTLRLIRAENRDLSSLFFEEEKFDANANSENILLDDVVAINFSFGKNKLNLISPPLVSYNNMIGDPLRFVFEDSSSNELPDVVPDYVDVLISTVDFSNERFFTIAESKGGDVTSDYEDIQNIYDTSTGLAILESDLVFEGNKKYAFPLEGHVWNKEAGYVLHYRKIGSDPTFYFTLQTGSKASSPRIDENTELYITNPIFKRIYLK